MQDRVFLFDVDNTLLDNDYVQDEMGRHIADSYGEAARDREIAAIGDFTTLDFAAP